MDFTGFYSVLLGLANFFSIFYLVSLSSPSVTMFYRVLPSFTGFHWVELGFLWVSTSFTGFLPSFTGFYSSQPRLTEEKQKRESRRFPANENVLEKKKFFLVFKKVKKDKKKGNAEKTTAVIFFLNFGLVFWVFFVVVVVVVERRRDQKVIITGFFFGSFFYFVAFLVPFRPLASTKRETEPQHPARLDLKTNFNLVKHRKTK